MIHDNIADIYIYITTPELSLNTNRGFAAAAQLAASK